MTYINHLNQFLAISQKDQRLSSTHISMYLALFYLWNGYRFAPKFFINRDTVMALSHIGSKATYLRMLDDLHAFGYISHEKPTGKYGKSRISIRQFDDKTPKEQLKLFEEEMGQPGNSKTVVANPGNAVRNKDGWRSSIDTGLAIKQGRQSAENVPVAYTNSNASRTENRTPPDPQSVPIKDIDIFKEVLKSERQLAPTRQFPLKKNEFENTKTDSAAAGQNWYTTAPTLKNHSNGSPATSSGNKSLFCLPCVQQNSEKRKPGTMSTASIPQVTHSPVAPAFTDVKQFILRELNVNAGTYSLKVHGRSATNLSAEQAAHEALKFYSHYAAIGWMLGGINPIINWKAAARKWLLNCWQHVPRVAASTARNTVIPANHVLNNDGKDFAQAL